MQLPIEQTTVFRCCLSDVRKAFDHGDILSLGICFQRLGCLEKLLDSMSLTISQQSPPLPRATSLLPPQPLHLPPRMPVSP